MEYHKVVSLDQLYLFFFINDLPNVTNLKTKIFADDTKVYTSITNDTDRENLQVAIDNMYSWTQKWLLKFNEKKCKVLHVGNNNPNYDYFIGEPNNKTKLEITELEKDLGVNIDPHLNFKKHIKITVQKATGICYSILRNFTFRTQEVLVPLFKTLVRPILEYGNPVWNNCINKYLDAIEQVQRKFTKFIHCLKDLPYEERLYFLNLHSLEYRRLRGDMIQVYKIAHNYYDKVSVNDLIVFKNDCRLRGHNFTIIKKTTNKQMFTNYFSNRVVNNWNKLPAEIVNADSINSFKNLFDKYNKDIKYKTNIC